MAAPKTRLRIGDMLVQEGVLTEAQLMEALAQQKKTRQKLGKTLVTMGLVEEKHFLEFLSKQLKIPMTNIGIPRWLMEPVLQIANRMLMGPLLEEDGEAVEAEQLGYERHFDAPIAELNPAVHEFQKLTIRKWEEYLAERDQLSFGAAKLPVWSYAAALE